MAHAMRAILLASATAATLIGRRPIRRASQSRFVPCWHISDDGHGAGDEQPAQMSIALLRDAAQSVFAAGRMLSRHQSDPCSKTAAGRERFPISDLGHQRGSDNRTNTRDFLQPSAFFTRAVPSVDTLLDGHDL